MLPFEHADPRATALAVYRQVLLSRVQRQRQDLQRCAQTLGQALRPASLWREGLRHARSHPGWLLAGGMAALSAWALRDSTAARMAGPALGAWRLWRQWRGHRASR